MTAQVVVMNSIGVAVAADSAVSIGTGKTYTTADKLFQLSHDQPVGVMVYQSASLAGLPWETIIKAFREQRVRPSEDIESYNAEFLSFVDENSGMFTADMRAENQKKLLESIFEEYVLNAAESITKSSKDWSEAGYAEGTRRAISMFSDYVNNVAQDLRAFTPEDIERSRESSFETARRLAWLLKKESNVEDCYAESLQQALANCLHKNVRSLGFTGVVIFGFGEKDYFPSCSIIEVDGFAAGHLRLVAATIERYIECGARVLPYAQTDMVDLFMDGIDPYVHEHFKLSTNKYVDSVAYRICEELKENGVDVPEHLIAQVRDNAVQGLQSIHNGWLSVMGENHGSIIDSIGLLPKEDLGNAAETLVDLTRFRRHASTTPETVGGPIDVAIITRGDGFVWTKRKHYFPAELNPRIIAKYHRPVQAGHDENG